MTKQVKVIIIIFVIAVLGTVGFLMYKNSTTCAIETCHGLDVKCGPNPPDACTEMYAVGDKCLQYAECGVQNGECQQIQNSQFTQCKSCVQKCIDANENDDINLLFECESKCN